MPDMHIGEISTRDIKNSNKDVIGQKTYVKLEYIGGYVQLEVDKGYADANLKAGMIGEAAVSMEPAMSGKTISLKDGNQFGIVDTGFDNFKLVGFTPKK
jgi:hypothetical protein